MFLFGRGDLGGIDNETLDFSQLEDYINDDNESNIYFQDALVSNDLKLSEPVKEQLFAVGSSVQISRSQAIGTTESSSPLHLKVEPQLPHGVSASPGTTTTSQSTLGRSISFRNRNSAIHSSFSKPHNLPDSPPDSGSEPPFSPPNEADPKLNCSARTSVEVLQQQRNPPPQNGVENTPEKHYTQQQQTLHLQHGKHVHDVGLSSSSSSVSPLHLQHHLHHHLHSHNASLPNAPIALQSSHSTSLPLLTVSSLNSSSTTPLLNHLSQNVLPSVIANNMHAAQAMMTPPSSHLEHLYSNGDEMMYENVSSPTVGANYKKRKISDSPKPRSGMNDVQIKTEPVVSTPVMEHSHGNSLMASSEDDYTLDNTGNERSSPYIDANYQCIRFQPFQQSTWVQLLDRDMNEITPPHFRVDADKGFNYSNADESFVCQKKNHFQVTVHVQNSSPTVKPCYVRTPDGTMAIEKFALHFHGVKMESLTQTIKVEQSQSDRSKKPFKPVPVELLSDQVTKTTVGRLHFSETTSNNMRKKGKPNPDQRFFYLVVSLCAHASGENDAFYPVVAHSSEKIIVRASNPGQFENDMELSWQKGTTAESIFHTGRVGINTDRPEEALVVHGNVKVTGHIVQPSDVRAKVDIQELDTKTQLKNVASLRIVRYRYLPEFATQVGLNHLADTGVIAQEVRSILPEAVLEAGDVRLQDGQLVENLLVVNKDRIFMENVGAVKELCKVTDNLENRIDELEKINKKLTSMKRKDSLKSTSTVTSRSGTSRNKKRTYKSMTKCDLSYRVNSCSSRFVQSTIVALVLIMAFCLVALATLYIMEWQNRHWIISYMPHPSIITVKSFPATSETLMYDQERTVPTEYFERNLSPRLATILWSNSLRTSTPGGRESKKDSGKSTTVDTFGLSQTVPPVSSHIKVPEQVMLLGYATGECGAGTDCPIHCCSTGSHQNREFAVMSENSAGDISHMKRGGTTTWSKAIKASIEQTIDNDVSDLSKQYTDEKKLEQGTSKERGHSRFSTASKPHKKDETNEHVSSYNHVQERKLQKRMLSSRDVPKNEPLKGGSLISGIYLVELNTSIPLEYCKEEKLSDSSVVHLTCNLFLSRHFSLSNVTLRLSSEHEVLSDLCSDEEFTSCPSDSDNMIYKDGSPNFNRKDHQANSWVLPVGSYLKSRYRFRIVPRSMFPDAQQLCSLPDRSHPITECVLLFQRRCDK